MTADSSLPPVRRRNPRGEGARLRSEILASARELLGAGEAITLRSIARQAGVAAPSIYRHFPDVDAVLSSLAEQAFDELTAQLTEERDRVSGAVARLRAVCAAYLQYARAEPPLYRLMFSDVWNASAAVDTHPEEEQRLRGLGMNAYGLLIDAIQTCVDDGSSDSTDPRQDATALWVALHGYAQLRATAGLFPWPADTENTLVDRLARLRP